MSRIQRLSLTGAALLFPFLLLAQKARADLIAAEKSFAALARDSGMKAAFLRYAAPGGVVFAEGVFRPAAEVWAQRPATPSLLSWQPTRADVSASGDLGFTSGPWTFRAQGPGDTVSGKGHFITVWQFIPSGGWKYLLDLGISYGQPAPEERLPDTGTFSGGGGNRDDLLRADSALGVRFHEQGGGGYAPELGPNSSLYRNGFPPAAGSTGHAEVLRTLPPGSTLSRAGAGISQKGDLAYTYGLAEREGKKAPYLHIWHRQAGQWRLAAAALPF